jgi:signal transduction histidine kinase
MLDMLNIFSHLVSSVDGVGIGIPLHLHNRLFQPFLQADSRSLRECGGTGVGLSICKVHIHPMFCMFRGKMFSATVFGFIRSLRGRLGGSHVW